MDKNTQDRGQSFDRVESRIELLEKQLMEKDEELKITQCVKGQG